MKRPFLFLSLLMLSLELTEVHSSANVVYYGWADEFLGGIVEITLDQNT